MLHILSHWKTYCFRMELVRLVFALLGDKNVKLHSQKIFITVQIFSNLSPTVKNVDLLIPNYV